MQTTPAALLGPLFKTYQAIDDLDQLRAAAQLAVQVEFTTIPAYLTAMYSIKDATSPAYQAVRSVVVEEMYHLIQVADLLVGVGGVPVVTGGVVPTYPTYLPSANQKQTPYIGLYPASAAVFRDVFMAIETPAPYDAPAEGDHYSTIGQLYKALELGLETCVAKYGEAAVFQPYPGMAQLSEVYLGKFGGKIIPVVDLASAKQAIKQIVQQGEGAVDPNHTLVPLEQYGAYNHYGQRADGTYGPILGTPYELSHYFKFMRVADTHPFPDSYPILANPRQEYFSNPLAQQKSNLFDQAYSLMLDTLQASFQVEYGADLYFKVSLPIMHEVLPALADDLMQRTPVAIDGNPSIGPNAAPAYLYQAGVKLTELAAAYRNLAQQLKAVEGIDLEVAQPSNLGHVAGRLEALSGTAQALGLVV